MVKFKSSMWKTKQKEHGKHVNLRKIAASLDPYTAISRKVVGRNVHLTIPKGNMGYGQYTVP